MKILNEQAELKEKNNLRMQLMCEMVGVLGPEGASEKLNEGLDLLHDNLPACLFIRVGYETYLVRTSQKGNPGEAYDELIGLDQKETIDSGQEGEKALRRANMPFPLLALTLGAGSILGYILHNKIQRVKESN